MPGPYIITLAVLVAVGCLLRNGSMLVTTALLGWDWGLCVLLSGVDGTGVSWFGLFCIDLGTAILLLLLHTERWQLAVVSGFVLMIGSHIAFAVHGNSHIYLTMLSFLSWAQALCVGGRALFDVLESAGYRDRIGRWLLARRPNPEGLAQRSDRT